MVPSLLESDAAIDADVEDHYGASGFSREDHRTGFRYVAWTTRPVDGEAAIHAFAEAFGHDGEAAQTAARRTSLGGAEAEPLDDFACPLAVERGGIHDYNTVVSVPPDDRNDHAMPERPDDLFLRGVNAFSVLPAHHFVTQRRPQQTDHAIDRRGDQRNLDAAGPRQSRQARIVVSADNFLRAYTVGVDYIV